MGSIQDTFEILYNWYLGTTPGLDSSMTLNFQLNLDYFPCNLNIFTPLHKICLTNDTNNGNGQESHSLNVKSARFQENIGIVHLSGFSTEWGAHWRSSSPSKVASGASFSQFCSLARGQQRRKDGRGRLQGRNLLYEQFENSSTL